MNNDEKLLEIQNLTKCFKSGGGFLGSKVRQVYAVDHVNFDIKKGETLGLVGESGCGKSTLGRSILQLITPSEGSVLFHGQDLTKLSEEEMRLMRRDMQIIFQDPYSCLNPRMNVMELVKAPLDVFREGSVSEREEKVREMLSIVGLNEQHLYRFPHEFSGGQRQRVGIARALITHPEFVVCDEPVSALDVSVRASVLNLMKKLQDELQLTYLFISHDLSVVKHISDRVAVMYLGNIVEITDKKELYSNPLHPYTQALLSSIPIPDPDIKTNGKVLQGDLPSPYNPPTGCKFHTRCEFCTERCKEEKPLLREVAPNHFAACHMVE